MELDIIGDAQALAKVDADFKKLIRKIGLPEERHRAPNLATLIHIIVSQQISLAAASSIWEKFTEQLHDISPKNIIRLGEQGLRNIGFTRSKSTAALNLCQHMMNGTFEIDAMFSMDDNNAKKYIMRLSGFVEWSASIFLIFCLGRPDIWPSGDIALQEATKSFKKLNTRPKPKQMDEISIAWEPFRSTAAHLLWHYYAKVVRNQKMKELKGFQ